jgi:hypothetical protein
MIPPEINPKKKEEVFPWTREQEELLAEWSEKATCYRWLHGRAEKSYRRRNYTFTIPVIILSTLTGTANFAMDSFVPEEHKQIAMAAVGSVNIFAGILSTLQNFLRYAELMESHRLSEVQWSKFGRNIEVELALDPKRRKSAHDFMKICRAEYDRLIEQSPTIDDDIIKQFKRNFKNIQIKVPAMCNGLDKCKIYERSKEDKLEDMMTHVGQKLRDTHKVRKWNIHDIPKLPISTECIPDTISENNTHHAQQDIDDLKSISIVSKFKQKSKGTDIPDIENPSEDQIIKDKLQEVIDDVKRQDEGDETVVLLDDETDI